ncbi:hypothetical protein C2E23DRAFT_863933 [Lenzites betulinus]|nr:hypothetical protein C2E23DRAFT_863933 [Lenzites betulinus]
MDTTVEGLRKLKAFVEKTSIPEGTQDGMDHSGFLALQPGDCVIARERGDLYGDNDELLCWVTPVECFPEEQVQEFIEVRDLILGPDRLRTPRKATFFDGSWSGGVAWERDEQGVNVETGPRCYTLGNSFQAAAKLREEAMEIGNPDKALMLAQRTDALNFPRIGGQHNTYFSTMQLNLSPTQGADANKASNLSIAEAFRKDLGNFGGKHTDGGDTSGAKSHLLCCSDIRSNEDPGVFTSCCFSGHYTHGRFRPTAPSGTSPDPWSYRVVVVSYPTSSAFEPSGKYTLGHFSEGTSLYIPPELMDPQKDNRRINTTPTSVAADGHVLTTRHALMEYIGRSLVQIAHRLVQEVAPEVKAEVDSSALLDAITYEHPDSDERMHVSPWPLAPGSTAYSEQFQCTRAEIPELWAKSVKRKLRFFPELVDTEYWAKYQEPLAGNPEVNQDTSSMSRKGKERAVGTGGQVGRKGKKRHRENEDIFNLNTKTRVQTVRGLKFNNPTTSESSIRRRNSVRQSKRRRQQSPEPIADSDEDVNVDSQEETDELDDFPEQSDENDPDFGALTTRKGVKRSRNVATLSASNYARLLQSGEVNADEGDNEAMNIDEEESGNALAIVHIEDMTIAENVIDESWPYAQLFKAFTPPALAKYLKALNIANSSVEKEQATLSGIYATSHRQIYLILHASGKPSQYSAGYTANF